MKKIVLIVSAAILCFGIITDLQAAEASYENCKNGVITCVSYGNSYYVKTPMTDEDGKPVYGEDGTTPLQKMEFFAPTSNETNADGSLKYTASVPTGNIVADVKSLVLNGNITSIPQRAYDYNNGWSDTHFVRNLTDIDASGAKIESIGYMAFGENRYLKNIILPDTVKTISDSAFYSSGIQSIVIPDSVTSIGDRAFLYSSLNTNVAIPEGTTVGDSAFNTNARILIFCPSGAEDCRKSDNYSGAFARSYTTEEGVYKYGSHYYSSAESMAAANGAVEEGCETKASCQSKVLQNMKDKDLCTTDANCLKLFEIMADTDIICRTGAKNTVLTCSTYAKDMGIIPTFIEDYQPDGSIIIKNKQGDILGYKNKRSYTPAEAETVSGDTNTITLIYK
ncbi:MAG: leucine-rich repeat domain-containing protein [Alphaproteobacteria bacterium]|nr:leucine-rich repeat domain-containing protein [Alphaproteobacteria bacterium]